MCQSIDIDKAAEYVKNIVDNNRCAVCDKLNDNLMRYPCGHTSCNDCVPATECCPFCLTPPDSATFSVPAIDTPCAQRCQSASNLLDAFTNEFNIDIYKRHRLSEQLKLEKELFPQCIQAPAKYYNKRKSSKPSVENKENIITAFPGEGISTPNKMEHSNANVREWLNKCVKRKPLGDLNHSRTYINTNKQPSKVINTHKIDRSNTKRKHSEIWADENQTIIDNIDDQVIPSKMCKKQNTIKKPVIKKDSLGNKTVKNKNDSGISIDDDGVIIIDDSQSIVDKDMNAWLAVLNAEKYASTFVSESNFSQEVTQPRRALKVPFYIKGPLCKNCDDKNEPKAEKNDDQPNISITVESKSFTTIIKVSQAEENKNVNTKHSVEVQTDFNTSESLVNQGLVEQNISYIQNKLGIDPIPSSSKNESLFKNEASSSLRAKSVKENSNIIIAESDSDEEVLSTSLVVTADVHKSHEEILVLDDIEDLEEHTKRPRRAARGYTPTSTDSSDKENYNPNRMKRSSNYKKKPVKK